MTTRVTVAIPIYNGARFLREALRSLVDQSEREIAIVCIDDDSTDDSVAVAASVTDGRIRIERNRPRLGLSANWNRAIELTNTEYLVIAHQDDVYQPDFIETMQCAMDTHPRAFAAHCKATTIGEDGRRISDAAAQYKERFWPHGKRVVEREPESELRLLRRGNYVIAPSVILRMDAIRAVGRFDERHEFVTDWEYWMKGLLAGRTLVGVPERLLRFRRHPATATLRSERTLRRYEEEAEVLKWLGERLPSDDDFFAIRNTLFADFIRRLAAGDSTGARTLLDVGDSLLPRFRESSRRRVMQVALRGGRAAGVSLQAAQAIFVRAAGLFGQAR